MTIDEFISFVTKNSDWRLDSWGNLKRTKNGREYRIHFKTRVARYEIKSSFGEWTRLYSADLRKLSAYINDEGRLILKGFKE